ncbi:MAG: hypothetical protein J5843_01430 [Clostridia bacterium]|nr:hypothetical protein [Clostridia bacterium]
MKPYLFIESGEGMRAKDIVGIFNLDHITLSKTTGKCLSEEQKNMRIVNVANDLPKSLIIMEEAYGPRLYLSGLSTDAIMRRLEKDYD